MWREVQLIGFAPDAIYTMEGALLRTGFIVPTDVGFGPLPMVSEGASTALNSQSLGGAVVSKTDATVRVFIGTATKLYEFSTTGSSITDRSDTGYSASTTDTWSFTQFGDVTLAVNKQNILRSINAGGAFAAVGIAPTPKASIIAVGGVPSAPVVMAFDYDDGTNNYRDGWFASGLSNPLNVTGWTTGTNQCANGRLLDDVPGPITAGIGFRDDFVAWKRTGMYLGRYTGDATNPWAWQCISKDIGCIGKNAVARGNDILYWADDAGIWMYDGSYPKLVPGYTQNYWAKTVLTYVGTDANRNFFRCIWDKPRHLLWVFAGVASGPTIGIGAAWNSISGIWTQQDAPNSSLHNITNAAETLYFREIIAPRYGVTTNSKLGMLTWGANGTEPHQGWIYGWQMTNFVNPPLINGIRPHWISSTGSTSVTWGFGNLYGFTSQRDVAPEVFNVATTVPLTFAEPGYFYGKLSAPTMTFNCGVLPGYNWEMGRVLSIDMAAQGKT